MLVRLSRAWGIVAAALSVFTLVRVVWADEADVVFDDSYVHEIHIYFDDPDWYNTLLDSHANDPNDPYFPARFEYEDIVLDPVGVRFKGNSSFWGYPGVKKSFKIDFNEYDDAQRFYGLKKLNLNNSFKDPTMLREKLFLDFLNNRVPAIRAVHSRLHVNDAYWGLYVVVEQVDKTFFQKHVGLDEDGNLFKGDPNGTLEWLGYDPTPYKDHYELKTNEAEDDWTDLINLIDVLNNTPAGDFQAAFDLVFEVSNYLETLAANMMFVNLDSYNGTGHNYYVYHRQDNDKFIHFIWDTNEASGIFDFGMSPSDIVNLGPHWLLPSAPPRPRPLCERLWQTFEWDRRYLRYLADMLRADFDPAVLHPRVDQLERNSLLCAGVSFAGCPSTHVNPRGLKPAARYTE